LAIEMITAPGISGGQGLPNASIASGSKTVYVAGQVSQDENGDIVGAGDLAAQTEQALLNVLTVLEAAGATFADVATTTMYVVDWSEEKVEQLFAGLGKVGEAKGSVPVGPTTLIPVPRLFVPEHLIEIQVTAVID